MCRLFLSINSKINIVEKLYLFLNQSIHKKCTPLIDNHRDHDYHYDGFGFAWLNENNLFEIYKQPYLFNQDSNLNNIMINMPTQLIIGHIRAKSNSDKSYNNTHPFYYNDYIFTHNGFIKNFLLHKNELLKYINTRYINLIKGETDSELLFYLYLSFLDLENDYIQSIKDLFFLLKYLNIEITANFIFGTPTHVLVTRYIIYNQDSYDQIQYPPSLYIDNQDGIIVSSEPITDNWTLIKENSILLFHIKNSKIIYYE